MARPRAVLLLAAGLLLSGCYVSTDYNRFPDGKVIGRATLTREWTGDGASLVLRGGGAFSASGLKLEYFECELGGVRKKSGGGTWTSLDDSDSTSVLVDFSDGCSATLWAGESDGKTVLWATQADDQEALILK
ncbi:hypothetical protein ACF081_26545 [Streptomyces longwoodensis]|uniref:hypothetical protein n=1 Tax=Streptomyces longwoodensis TaxID=68231 RepID=UPI0036F5A7AC